VIAVGAKWNIAHKSAVGRQARSVDPLASLSYTVDQLRRGDEGVREEGQRHAMKKHAGAYLEGCIASELKLGWRVGRIHVCGACCASV
jgi:hypothetical protein